MLTFASKQEKADFQLQIYSDRIEGWVSWEDDPLFRPTIGVFIDDVSKSFVPTERFERTSADGKVVEPCRFEILDIDVAEITATSSLTISCVEKGQVLRTIRPSSLAKQDVLVPPADAPSSKRDDRLPANDRLKRLFRQVAGAPAAAETRDIVDVEAILEAGRKGKRSFGHSGFLRFLSLPLIDQLNILFLDLLDRGPDPVVTADAVDRIVADEVTILDIRDEILGSQEFLSRGPFSPDTPVGAWCSWDGLNDLDLTLLPGLNADHPPLTITDGQALRSYVSLASSAGRLPRHLARIALGTSAKEPVLLNWCRNHFQVTCRYDAEVKDAPFAGDTALMRKNTTFAVSRELLSSVSVGKAGRRVDDVIRSQPGRRGHLTFGPYIKLTPGTHRISLSYQATVNPAVAPSSNLTIEVESGDVLFARSDVVIDATNTGTMELDFVVPATAEALVKDAGFEFRVAVDGRSDIVLDAMTFTQNIEAEGSISYPNVTDWLAAMSVGSTASRLSTGEIECPPKAPSDFVMFGPYVKLLPGDYRLTVEIACDVVGRSGKALTLEISEPTGVLVSTQALLALGANEVLLPFKVTPAANLAGVSGPLEFRLKSETGFGFRVTSILIDGLQG